MKMLAGRDVKNVPHQRSSTQVHDHHDHPLVKIPQTNTLWKKNIAFVEGGING